MDIACKVCGAQVPQPKRGYRLYCTSCKDLNDDIERIRRHISRLDAGDHEVTLTEPRMALLRYELFCLVAQLPRTRDRKGRYESSGVSPRYDARVTAGKPGLLECADASAEE